MTVNFSINSKTNPLIEDSFNTEFKSCMLKKTLLVNVSKIRLINQLDFHKL